MPSRPSHACVTATLDRRAAVEPAPSVGRRVAAAPHVLDPATLGDHVDRLYRAALALCGTPADAEDLVQEVYARVLSKPRLIRTEDVGYLLGVLRNTFISQYQQQVRRRTAPVEPSSLAEIPGRDDDPERALLAREVHRAVSRLPHPYREAVVAVDILGLSYSEAARALGVPTGTIMSRLYRGRAKAAADLTA